MSKEEMYNAALKMLSLSGKGTPVNLLKSFPNHYNWSLTEELINEGKLLLVSEFEGSSSLNLVVNDNTYYRTEVDDPRVSSIEFMRFYIGVSGGDEIVPLFNKTISEVIDSNRILYDTWLSKNQSKLDAIIELRRDLVKCGVLKVEECSHLYDTKL